MALAYTGQKFQAAGGAVTTSGFTSGNSLLVTVIGALNRTVSGITDDQANSYSLMDSVTGTYAKVWFFRANNITAPTLITPQVGGLGFYRTFVEEISGGPIDLDSGIVSTDGTSTPATGSTTPVQSGLAAATYLSPTMNGTLTGVSAGWTDDFEDTANATYAFARRTTTSGTAVSATWSGSHFGDGYTSAIITIGLETQYISSDDSITENLTQTGTVEGQVSSSDSITENLTETQVVPIPKSSSDSITENLTETTQNLQVQTTETTSESITDVLTETSSIEADVSSSDTITESPTESEQLTADVSSTDTVSPTVTETSFIEVAPGSYHKRLRVDLVDRDDNIIGSGPIVHLTQAQYSYNLDKIGTFTFSIPVIEDAVQYITDGVHIKLYREGEGYLFHGVVSQPNFIVDSQGNATLQVPGDSTARRTVWKSTRMFTNFSGWTPPDALANLLSGTGWAVGTVDTTTDLVNAGFNGSTAYDAVVKIAQRFGWHIREDNLSEVFDFGVFGVQTDIVLQNVPIVSGSNNQDLSIIPITGITIKEGAPTLWNRIFPFGAGQGVSALSLQYSTRTSPYTIQSVFSPDASTTLYYIEDLTSQGLYDIRETVVQFPDIAPISNSDAEITNAANTLYAASAALLAYSAIVPETYTVNCVGLTQLDSLQNPRIRPGDKVRLKFRGFAKTERGQMVWKDIDTNVWVLGFTRSFNSTGADSWQITVSTSDNTQQGPEAAIAQAISQLWTIQVAMKSLPFQDTYGPYRRSVDTSHNATFKVTYNNMITYLHRADLNVQVLPVVANAQGASGGGSHSHSVSGQAASSGGGGTSSGGSSHSHSVSGQTASGSGAHTHYLGYFSDIEGVWPDTTNWGGSDPPYFQWIIFYRSDGVTQAGFIAGRQSDPRSEASFGLYGYGAPDHSHPVSTVTSGADSSHTHSVSAHTHSVTTTTSSTDTGHTHTLTYGIYQGPNPSNAQIHIIINGVDVTASLGGPWNNDFEVDVTQYLVDAQGRVLRTTNTIQIQTNAASVHDVEVALKSFVTATTVVPV